MHLKSLEINGYKSFGKKGTLSFNSPISAIVGPNGSGKSNVAEAFRFALGEQSLKNMRGKRGEDMIYNGGSQSGRLNKASVKITFNNEDRLLPIDFDEVTIERVVHRDGVNEYFLNDSQVRLKDISELLVSANIGSSGHHIISQGEADRILNASPKEKRSILEDALGLKVYQYKKSESEKKLVKTEENIAQVESLRREIAPHIRFLKKQVEKLEKGKEMRAALVLFYKEYFKRESLYLENAKKEIAQKKVEPLHRKEELKQVRLKLDEEIRSQEKSSEKIREVDDLQEIIRGLHSKKNELLRNSGSLEGQLESIKKLKQRQEKEAEEISTKTIPLNEVVTLRKELDEFNETSNIDELISFVKRIKESLHNLVERYREKKDESINNFDNDILEIEKRKEDVDRDLNTVTAELDQKMRELNQLQQSLDNQKEGVLEAEKKILDVMQELNRLDIVLQRIESEETVLLRDNEEYERELNEAVVLTGREAIRFDDFEIKSGEVVLNREQITAEDREVQKNRRKELERMKIRVEDLGTQGGDDVMKEFQDVTEREEFLIKEIEDLHKSSDSLKQMIVELEEKINTRFKEGINKINSEFQSFFALMFGGGSASLNIVKQEVRAKKSEIDELVQGDTEDVEEEVEEGIDINVNLPRKKVKGLMMLSGGERALTSIALLFAMSSVNPPPFIILDETDAALDEANSKKYGDMIENLSKHSQLILITHNRETMSRAGILYGVTMQQGLSQILSIMLDEGFEYAK